MGRQLRGRSRADEHRAVLAAIARIAEHEQVDLIIVAGDLFDGSAPAPESEQIVYAALMDLARTGAEVIIIAGNHDSPQRLAAVRPLLDLTHVRTVPFPLPPDGGGVIDLRTRAGTPVRIAALPFLSQRGIVKAEHLMKEEPPDSATLYADRCRSILEVLCGSFDARAVNIIVSHLTVLGGLMGGGEREAHTIFEYHVPSTVFPVTAHYVALGHLHRAQNVAGACPIWYSGSPLQLDFGETANEPVVLIVEAEPGAPAHVRDIPLLEGRRLRTLHGTLAHLETLVGAAGDDLLRIMVAEPARPGLADEVRALFPNAVDVLVRPAEPPDGPEPPPPPSGSPIELFAKFLEQRNVQDERLIALFRELHESAVAPEAV